MIVRMMEVGPLMANCYIVGDETNGEAAVFDPGGHVERILRLIEEEGLEVKYIFNTHSHFDHVGANVSLQEATGAPILTHPDEAPGLAGNSRFIQEGDVLEVGSIKFRVIDLRGHSIAGIGFVFNGRLNLEGKHQFVKMVICGDALFAGSIGATDHPQGDLPLLLENIRTRIFSLPDETLVLPGHGPVSTVGDEKRYNPFFQ